MCTNFTAQRCPRLRTQPAPPQTPAHVYRLPAGRPLSAAGSRPDARSLMPGPGGTLAHVWRVRVRRPLTYGGSGSDACSVLPGAAGVAACRCGAWVSGGLPETGPYVSGGFGKPGHM
ncbi:hypothetical protein GCM10027038_12680 [Arthrobacter bambusae]